MMEILYSLLGYFIIFILLFVTAYGTFRTVMGGRILLGVLIVFAVMFTSIFQINSNPSCSCFFGNDSFRQVTEWFMGDVLVLAGDLLGLIILFLALNAFIRGERSIAPRILFEAFINLLVASFWSLIFSSIVSFYACPLICEQYIDWNLANENIWASLRAWLGTGS